MDEYPSEKHRRNSRKEKEKIMLTNTFKNTKLFIGAVAIIAITTAANAAWVGNLQVDEIATFGDGAYQVRFVQPVENTCTYWGFNFRVKLEQDKDKSMYKSLVLAMMTGKKVSIGYKPSTAPGTTHTDGCTLDTVATIWFASMKR